MIDIFTLTLRTRCVIHGIIGTYSATSAVHRGLPCSVLSSWEAGTTSCSFVSPALSPPFPEHLGQCRPQSRRSEMFAEVEKMTEFRMAGKYIRMMCQRKFDTKYFRARDSYGNYLIWKL